MPSLVRARETENRYYYHRISYSAGQRWNGPPVDFFGSASNTSSSVLVADGIVEVIALTHWQQYPVGKATGRLAGTCVLAVESRTELVPLDQHAATIKKEKAHPHESGSLHLGDVFGATPGLGWPCRKRVTGPSVRRTRRMRESGHNKVTDGWQFGCNLDTIQSNHDDELLREVADGFLKRKE